MTTLIAFVFVLGLLVFVHELGHFLVAKKSGIKVERFSLGFPPKLIGKKIGDTEYMIGVVPLGGYVKMSGENITEEDYIIQPGDFMAASVFKRSLVILAGPVMNFVLAIFLFFVVYWSTGIPEMKPNSTEIGIISPDAPAEKAGLRAGANIISIDGNRFKDFNEMASYVRVRPNSNINVVWFDSGKTVTATIHTMSIPATDSLGRKRSEGRIGIGPVYNYKPTSPWQALKDGFSANLFLTGQMFSVLWKLVSHQESIKALGGPVLIAQQAGAAARQGFASLLGLAAFLSVNLAIVNLLPIPVLDGGHLVFLIIEAFKKRPMSLKGRLIAQQIGMGLLFLLMIVVTYNDIIRLITGIIR
jgi:regulator of sigma E protease